MKLCIVRPNNTIAEIIMCDRQPSLENVNNQLLFFENYQYRLIIRDNDGFESTELYVGDYAIPLHYNVATDCYETENDIVFSGCFDLAYVSICAIDVYGEEKIFYTEFLRIATTKQTAKKVEQMLEEIEKNLPNFLDVCFSKNKKKSGIIKNNVRSIWNTMRIVDEILKIYEENYGYFCNHKKASVESVPTVVDVHSMRMIEQESLRWIVCNPDNLVLSDKQTGIEVRGKQYIPSKVKTYISEYSYDVFENQVILGFLKTVIEYLNIQISEFNKEIIELQKIPDSIIVQLPNTHEITGRCVYVYYKGVIEKFVNRRDILLELFYKYKKMMRCTLLDVYGLPKLTNTFKQVYHYRLCYECMIKWFESGDYSFNHLNYLFKLKTLSRIFEYFCLIKIQKAISQCGYVLEESNRIIYDEEEKQEEINNEYIFSGNEYSVTLFYEPTIWTEKVNDNFNLYSTGYNFSKGRWNDRWTPDFVLKISTEHKDYYYILDAKYSNALNVKKIYMPELVLKYSAQIASKDKFFSDVIGVGAVYPGDNDKMYFFKKNDVISSKISIPQYFSLTIVGEDIGDGLLKERLKDLLQLIDVLESNGEYKNHQSISDELSKKVRKKFVNSFNLNGNEQNKIERDRLYSGNSSREQQIEIVQNDEHPKQVEAINMVTNGKKCHFYGKNLCLRRKVVCDVAKKSCDYYVPKNIAKLVKEENSCRNFMQTVKRGKVINAECVVSGLPGCIGKDNCAFYLKKNKS